MDKNFLNQMNDIESLRLLEDYSNEYKLELEKHDTLQSLLLEISSDFLSAKIEEFDLMIQLALEKIGRAVDADRSYIFQYDFDKNICINSFEWCNCSIPPRIADSQNISLSLIPEWVENHKAKKSFYVSDISELRFPQEVRLLKSGDIKSLITVPIVKGESLYGFVGFNSIKSNKVYSECEKKVLENFSNILLTILIRKDYEAKIQQKNEELEQFFSINLDLLCIGDMDGNFIRLNKAWEDTLGYSNVYLANKKIFDFIHPDDIELTIQAISKLRNNETLHTFVNRYRDINGKYHFIEWRSKPYNEYIYSAARDITERKIMEENLYFEKEAFRTTLLSIGDGVVSVNRNLNVVFMNNISETITGWDYAEIEGMSIENIFHIVDESNLQKIPNLINSVVTNKEIVRSSKISSNLALMRKDNSLISVEFNISPIKNKQGDIEGAVIVLRDVNEKRKAQKQVEYLSFHDYLTGLYNRRYFEEELMRLDTKRNLPLSIVMLDVNGLKLTNDAFGHSMGDELLKKVGNILKTQCRSDDIIARLGGDEFAIVLPKTDDAQTNIIINRITEASLKENLDSIMISVAIGHSVKESPTQDTAEIIAAAENNMYKNKIKSGKIMRKRTFELILKTLNKNYENEQSHNISVSDICRSIGEALEFSNEQLASLCDAALLHDIGKIIIPPEIINKPSKLTQEEFEIVQRHPETGYQILKSIEQYSHLARYVLSHHERWDGKGYPRRQKNSEIPIFSRIISIADAYDAMTSDRPYRKALSKVAAIEELQRNAGTQFDPNVVDVFVKKVLKYNP